MVIFQKDVVISHKTQADLNYLQELYGPTY